MRLFNKKCNRTRPGGVISNRKKKETELEGFALTGFAYWYWEIVMLQVDAKNFGPVAVLFVQGQVVTGETEILRNAVLSLSEVSAVKLDLARVTTIDARGLGVMLALREQVQSKGIRFELMNVNKQVTMVLKLTRLDSVFQITSGVEFFPAVSRNRRASVMPLLSCA
jgi:anti-anti-sigma factor